MSPNHFFDYDDNGTLGIFYNGNSPVYLFEDDYFTDELGEWPLTAHVRDFLYEYIQYNGDRELLYSFDGGMENGIDEARGFISSAIEAYIELDNDEKVNLHNTMLTKLKNDKTNFIDKENSAKELYNIFTKFINETKLDNYNDTVVNSFKEVILEKLNSYISKANILTQDIKDESEWELPKLSDDSGKESTEDD